METITLNDGTEIRGHCIEDDLNLFVYLDKIKLTDAFMLFSNPDRTRRITENNHGNEHIYEGYTEIYAINAENGNSNLTMRRARE